MTQVEIEAADEMLWLMRHISEERWSAGWARDLEFILWGEVVALVAEPRKPARFFHDLSRLAPMLELAALSAVTGGWWTWDDGQDRGRSAAPVFVPSDEWRQIYRSWQERCT